MERKEYQLHDVIFKEQEYQKWMYSICEGAVDICTGYGTALEKKLVTLTKGHSFGEIGLIGMMPRTATAVAAADHVVLEQINEEDWKDYLENHPENLQPIMSSVSRRIRELTEDLSLVTQMTNEAMRKQASGDFLTGWLSGSVSKLIGKLKAKKSSASEYAAIRQRLQALAGQIPPAIRFSAGNVIFRTGDEADCMYSIHEGLVDIYSDYQTENEKLLATLKRDDVFGEMGILDDMPRSATAVCKTDCTVLVVRPENFMHFFKTNPEKILQILQQMCAQLRQITKTYLQVCKTLEDLGSLENAKFREDEALAALEHIRQSQLCINMYDLYGCADRMYDYFTN